MTTRRRYEILLPLAFNDGRLIADGCPRCLPDSLAETFDRFGAFTLRPEVARGSWSGDDGRRYQDTLSVLSVDVDDTNQNRAWIAHLKAHLLERYEQLEIYITSHPVEVH
jgi:hypothetical protein